MFDKLDPRKQGAETPADVGVFLLGASLGGLVDAFANVFGFAEPLVVAGLGGAGALSLKKLLWDAPKAAKKPAEQTGQPSPQAMAESSNAMAELETEAALLAGIGKISESEQLTRAIEEGKKRGLSAQQIRALYERVR